MMTKMMTIHLVRHGKTDANEKKLYCGATDLPLSANGVAELAELKARGIYPAADMYFTSGMARAAQTLELLYGNVKNIPIPDLAEFNFGQFEMKSYDELKGNGAYQAWIMDESGDVACPGGESRNHFDQRVVRGFAKVIKQIRESAVIICHGGVIVSIMERQFPGQRNFYEWQPKPGRGYSLIFADELSAKWRNC